MSGDGGGNGEDDEDDRLPPRGERKLGVIGAIGWGAVAYLVMFLIQQLYVTLRPGRATDVVGFTLCSALAFSICAYGISRFYLADKTTSEALSLRSVTPLVYVLGALVGVAWLLPATYVSDVVIGQFPYSDEEKTFVSEAFTFSSRGHKIAFAVAAIGIGPAFEDLLFRGALYRAIRRTEPAQLAIVATAGAFAFVHSNDPRALPHALLGGLVLGLLREATGSVWVSLAAHVAYNGVPVMLQLLDKSPMMTESANLPILWAVSGLAATAALIAMVVMAGRRFESIRAARAEDTR